MTEVLLVTRRHMARTRIVCRQRTWRRQ